AAGQPVSDRIAPLRPMRDWRRLLESVPSRGYDKYRFLIEFRGAPLQAGRDWTVLFRRALICRAVPACNLKECLMTDQDADLDLTLKAYEAYLRLQVRILVSPLVRNHLDLSGIVNETLVKAWKALDWIRQLGEGERAAWLRTVLANHLKDKIEKLCAQCRDF